MTADDEKPSGNSPDEVAALDGAAVLDQAVLDELRGMLGRLTGSEDVATADPDTALFGAGIGLDSLTGTLLLVEVKHRFGVDVASEDLNLDAMASLSTLAAYISARTVSPT